MDGSNDVQKIQIMISGGKFIEAKSYLSLINNEALRGILLDISMKNNICSYAFIAFLLLVKETVEQHIAGAELLSYAFHYCGGYEVSLYHIQRAIEISPHDLSLQTNLFFYNETPPKITNAGLQRIVTNDEAKIIAEKILQKDPANDYALKKLTELRSTTIKDLPAILPSGDMENIIYQTISAGRFLEMRDKLNEIDSEVLRAILFDVAAEEEECICAYAFVWFVMLEERESAQYHCLAADILTGPLKQLIGAHPAALYHVRRAIELSPNDSNVQKRLLLFNTIPEKMVSDEEAAKIGEEIKDKQ